MSGRRSSSQQEPSRIRDEIASDGFYGGLLQCNGAQMHMGKLGVGLSRAAVLVGVRVYEHAAVAQLERCGPAPGRLIDLAWGKVVDFKGGAVTCNEVTACRRCAALRAARERRHRCGEQPPRAVVRR